MNNKIVVHLRSQEGQPYGSERKCCNYCGVMLLGENSPLWVEYKEEFATLTTAYVQCGKDKTR